MLQEEQTVTFQPMYIDVFIPWYIRFFHLYLALVFCAESSAWLGNEAKKFNRDAGPMTAKPDIGMNRWVLSGSAANESLFAQRICTESLTEMNCKCVCSLVVARYLAFVGMILPVKKLALTAPVASAMIR